MNKQRGVSLIETLISMIVIMFGLLGIAGMQLLAINNTDTSRYKTLATMIASSMAAKMQTNTLYWGSPPTSVTINGSTITSGPASYTLGCTNVVCNAPQMAATDLLEFGNELQATAVVQGLPSGHGQIDCSSGTTPAVCKITITWSEKNVALIGPAVAYSASSPMASGSINTASSYQTVVSIPL